MISVDLSENALLELGERYGSRIERNAPVARYTAARLGGPADALMEVQTLEELSDAVMTCWQNEFPYWVIGGGSNVLVSDKGLHGLVLINHTRRVRFDEQSDSPSVWAESGVNFGMLSRQAAAKGFSGLEWAAGIPGTIGGAVVGNAGAHGGDMAGNLQMAEILHRIEAGWSGNARREDWPVEKLEYVYRGSILKRNPGYIVVLAARLGLTRGDPQAIQAKLDELVAFRRRSQPPGASMGSMFKNPSGDFAGRLIEAAGLKGFRVGNAQISSLHANFFINLGGATAFDIYELIEYARKIVADRFGITLELEIELIGDW
jgi:UDP-N-acetylmuramate dehydrogenase